MHTGQQPPGARAAGPGALLAASQSPALPGASCTQLTAVQQLLQEHHTTPADIQHMQWLVCSLTPMSATFWATG